MLIVSKFHDYYDIGASVGIDKTIVYKRNQFSFKTPPGQKKRGKNR